MAEKLILVGRVSGAFGVRGEFRISAFTADPMALLVYRTLLRADGSLALTLTAARPHKGGIAARAVEIASPEDADALKGLDLYIPRDALPATEEDEFYTTDLIGLAAVSPAGEALGCIVAVRDFGAGDILEVRPEEGASWLVAFTLSNVPQIRLADGVIVIDRPREA